MFHIDDQLIKTGLTHNFGSHRAADLQPGSGGFLTVCKHSLNAILKDFCHNPLLIPNPDEPEPNKVLVYNFLAQCTRISWVRAYYTGLVLRPLYESGRAMSRD